MNSKIMELQEQLRTESQRTQDRVDRLMEENEQDQIILDSYVDNFTIAVQDGVDEQELLDLEKQRDEAYKRVKQNKEIIKILSSATNNKALRLRVELVGEHFAESDRIEAQASEICEKLKTVRAQLIKGVSELKVLNEEQVTHLRAIDQLHIDRENQLRFGIQGNREIDDQRSTGDDLRFWTVMAMIESLTVKPFQTTE
ncbi:hypothetical protein ACX1C1_05255 [Paenibacillus sp. strain BS8-2]